MFVKTRDQRYLAPHTGQGCGGHRRLSAPDVGGPVLPPRDTTIADHVRWTWHDGLGPAGRERRHDGLTRRRSVGDYR